MSYTQICIHYVWATRSRKPMLIQPYRQQLFEHIRENAKRKGIHLDRVNGYLDHVHCLIWLQPTQTIASIAQQLKGESTYWFNRLSGIPARLRWQENYFAVAVSPSQIPRVRAYIDRQEQHHAKKTYENEYNKLMDQYLLQKGDNGGIENYSIFCHGLKPAAKYAEASGK